MRTIPLTQGLCAEVDDADYKWLNQWQWHTQRGRYTFYAVRQIYVPKQKQICERMHRVILGLQPHDKQHTDHRDGNGLNNQRSNLRICTITQNNRSVRKKKNGSSKYKGVRWCPRDCKWYSQIKVNKKRIFLGRFKSDIDAAIAYDLAAVKHHKEFALTNEMLRLLK